VNNLLSLFFNYVIGQIACKLFNSAVSTATFMWHRIKLDDDSDQWTLKGCRRKHSWFILSHYLNIYLEGLRETMKNILG
jgi:hypothetical protein